MSFHAEEVALKYCKTHDKKNKYHIYIWRYSNDGKIKTAYCCNSCSNLIKKYNREGKIFTFVNGKITSAIIDDPEVSIGYKILRNIF